MNSELVDRLGKSETRVIGIGVTAFNRIGPAVVYPNYEIVAYKDGTDTDCLGRLAKITTVQGDMAGDGGLEQLSSASILRHTGVRKYITQMAGKKAVFLYKATAESYVLGESLGCRVIANHPDIRDVYEDKREFFRIGREIGLPMIEGEQRRVEDVDTVLYRELVNRIGNKLVFQLTDITTGGGKGTFFISGEQELKFFRREVERLRRERQITQVNITKYVEGESASVTGCVTRHGVLAGIVQTQVVDVPQLGGLVGRSGKFQGHDWSYRNYEGWVQLQAEKIVRRLGEHMSRRGYKGIFGVDLIVDDTDKQVYPVECNPRYTGAFPVYSMLQQAVGEIPLDLIQLMEFLGVDYELDVEAVNKSWKIPKQGAHVVLCNPYDQIAWVGGEVTAGVYRLDSEGLVKIREGAVYRDIMNEGEVVLTDGCPKQGQTVGSRARWGKLIFKERVLDKPGVLQAKIGMIVQMLNKMMEFKVVE